MGPGPILSVLDTCGCVIAKAIPENSPDVARTSLYQNFGCVRSNCWSKCTYKLISTNLVLVALSSEICFEDERYMRTSYSDQIWEYYSGGAVLILYPKKLPDDENSS